MMAALQAWLESVEELLRFLKLDTGEVVRIGLRVLVIWLLAWVGLRALAVVARRIVRSVDDGDDTVLSHREKRGQTVAALIRSVGRVLVFLIALLLTLNIFIEIGPLLAGAGVAGLAISFGAQSLVKDLIAGFFILFEDQFTVGDNVELAGKSGKVERLTLRAAVIRDLDGVLHTIPNGSIQMVSNKTRGWSRSVIEVGVAYATDVDQALSVFRDESLALARDPEWKSLIEEGGEPDVLGIERLDDSAVVIRVAIRVTPGNQWKVAREFRRRIKKRLDREGIEIPFPQRTVHLRDGRPAG